MMTKKKYTYIMILTQNFYAQDTISVAQKLLGCYLVHLEAEEEITLGRIVETEAYLVNDPAAHSFVGKTKRNSVMFGPVGHAYVYFIYGMHYCFNAVTGLEGAGEAVLIRALEPLQGITVMQRRRAQSKSGLLCNGPARLAQAMGITLPFNGCPLQNGPLQIWSADSLPDFPVVSAEDIVRTTRVGITKAREQPLRFYLKGNKYISVK